jgi:hypothetical protein
MSEERRDALKIIGAIGATCMFPFQADELYGQHDHAEGKAAVHDRKFFSEAEFRVLTALVDEIIPATETPSASQAGVPAYIDFVATRNAALGAVCREGLGRLAKKKFLAMSSADKAKFLGKLCRSAEVERKKGVDEKFWVAIKNLTADGYYTSKVGIREELGYQGNAVLESFPSCDAVPEH